MLNVSIKKAIILFKKGDVDCLGLEFFAEDFGRDRLSKYFVWVIFTAYNRDESERPSRLHVAK